MSNEALYLSATTCCIGLRKGQQASTQRGADKRIEQQQQPKRKGWQYPIDCRPRPRTIFRQGEGAKKKKKRAEVCGQQPLSPLTTVIQGDLLFSVLPRSSLDEGKEKKNRHTHISTQSELPSIARTRASHRQSLTNPTYHLLAGSIQGRWQQSGCLEITLLPFVQSPTPTLRKGELASIHSLSEGGGETMRLLWCPFGPTAISNKIHLFGAEARFFFRKREGTSYFGAKGRKAKRTNGDPPDNLAEKFGRHSKKNKKREKRREEEKKKEKGIKAGKAIRQRR